MSENTNAVPAVPAVEEEEDLIQADEVRRR